MVKKALLGLSAPHGLQDTQGQVTWLYYVLILPEKEINYLPNLLKSVPVFVTEFSIKCFSAYVRKENER